MLYEYDGTAGTFREEFMEFPLITYYDNGILEAGWSHNQGLAGEFWPYTLYEYHPEADTYARVAWVDAWDRVMTCQDVDRKGREFPEDVDKDGDGFLYYLMLDDMDYDNLVDNADNEKWRDSYTGGAAPVEVDYQELTQENIGRVMK